MSVFFSTDANGVAFSDDNCEVVFEIMNSPLGHRLKSPV